jgi:hypothetical protein
MGRRNGSDGPEDTGLLSPTRLLRAPGNCLERLLCAPVEIDSLAVAPTLPLSQLGVVKVGASAVGQDEIIAESSGAVKQPSEVALGAS